MPKLPHAEVSRVMRYEYVHASSSNSVLILKNCQLQRASISKFCQYIL